MGIDLRRSGKIKEAITAETSLRVEFGEASCELCIGLLIGVIARTVKKIGCKVFPLCWIDWADVRHCFRGFSGCRTKTIVVHRRSRKTDESIPGAKRIVRGKIEERGNDFAFSKIAGCAKKNDRARIAGAAVSGIGRTGLCSHAFSWGQAAG